MKQKNICQVRSIASNSVVIQYSMHNTSIDTNQTTFDCEKVNRFENVIFNILKFALAYK